MSDIESDTQIAEPKPGSDIDLPEADLEKADVNLEKVESPAVATPPPAIAYSPPPNGGTLAWLQVFATFWMWFASL